MAWHGMAWHCKVWYGQYPGPELRLEKFFEFQQTLKSLGVDLGMVWTPCLTIVFSTQCKMIDFQVINCDSLDIEIIIS